MYDPSFTPAALAVVLLTRNSLLSSHLHFSLPALVFVFLQHYFPVLLFLPSLQDARCTNTNTSAIRSKYIAQSRNVEKKVEPNSEMEI